MSHYCTLAVFGDWSPENHLPIVEEIETLLARGVRGKVILFDLLLYCLEQGLNFGIETHYTREGNYYKPQVWTS
jgi:hypothetical protein